MFYRLRDDAESWKYNTDMINDHQIMLYLTLS